jgi:hypothetical protein
MFPQVEAVLLPSGSRLAWYLPQIPDAELGQTGNPRFLEHDANGFRNAGVPDTADIVAIGDSFTYGAGMAPDKAWPQVLEKLTSCRVYNMAVPGYGPLQYAVLAQRGLRLKPRFMLVGIYFGNDFFDNWVMYLRNPGKYPVPEQLLNEALASEQQESLSRSVHRRTGTLFSAEQASVDGGEARSLKTVLSENSALWGYARAVKSRLFPARYTVSRSNLLSGDFRTAVAALSLKQLEYVSVFDGGDWRTILASRYREIGENIDDPRIRVGFWLTQWAMRDIRQLAERNGITPIFILLPTKESVFVDKVKKPDDHDGFKKLIMEEDQHRNSLIRYVSENNFAYVDMTPALRSMEQQPYFESADGHPNAIGQREIAKHLSNVVGTCRH